MSQHYDPEFKKQIVRLHLEEGRTLISLQKEYIVSKAAISTWIKQFCDECQNNSKTDFTYLFISNGNKRYNCTIIDLHDSSVVASITNKKMTSDLAVRTL